VLTPLVKSCHINIAYHNVQNVVRRPTMAHLQNWFGLLPPDIATILPWSESLDKPQHVTMVYVMYSTQLSRLYNEYNEAAM